MYDCRLFRGEDCTPTRPKHRNWTALAVEAIGSRLEQHVDIRGPRPQQSIRPATVDAKQQGFRLSSFVGGAPSLQGHSVVVRYLQPILLFSYSFLHCCGLSAPHICGSSSFQLLSSYCLLFFGKSSWIHNRCAEPRVHKSGEMRLMGSECTTSECSSLAPAKLPNFSWPSSNAYM